MNYTSKKTRTAFEGFPFDDFFGIKPDNGIQETKNGSTTLTVNVVGHDPKNVKVEVDGHKLLISADAPEKSNNYVKDIEIEYNISDTTNPQPISAEIKYGLLTLKFEKAKENEKNNTKIKISY